MIRIDHQELQTDAWQEWRRDCERATQALCSAVAAGREPEIDQRLYARLKKVHYFAKNGPFGGRCAYCESLIGGTQPGDIDHFRPKNAVTDENDSPISVIDAASGESRRHPGYYWLAYDWRNLVPCCNRCNRPSTETDERTGELLRLGKRSRFPVDGQHAQNADELDNERPYLINPAEEDPAPHLKVDLSTGYMQHLTPRGEMCVRVFGLNLRDLPDNRNLVMDKVRLLRNKLQHSDSELELQADFDKLKRLLEGRDGHAAAARAMNLELHRRHTEAPH